LLERVKMRGLEEVFLAFGIDTARGTADLLPLGTDRFIRRGVPFDLLEPEEQPVDAGTWPRPGLNGVADASPMETIHPAEGPMYIPVVRERVRIEGRAGLFLVVRVDQDEEMAELVGLDREDLISSEVVPFSKLLPYKPDAPPPSE